MCQLLLHENYLASEKWIYVIRTVEVWMHKLDTLTTEKDQFTTEKVDKKT